MSCGEVFGVCHEINPLYIQAVPRPLRSALMEHRQGNKSTDINIFHSNSIIYYKNNRNKKARKCLVLLVTLDLILLIEEKNVVTSL